ncbi:MAG TPA: dihydroxyacetone kinase subunit DhaL [Terrimicrobiaceae bacterium]|nr:dihydroxyacetone kinase subunit DhaL [Terrimicrobiaceae bacterium]
MNTLKLLQVERVVQTLARVSLENEKYFCDLDGEMGDADFGKSIGDGFRAILDQLPSIERADIGSFLIKVGTIFASHAGGTSGPIWGTAFLKAGLKSKGKTELTAPDLVEMGRAAVQGMMARGSAQVGDKTLLDAIVPALDKIEELSRDGGDDLKSTLEAAAEVATAAVEGTRQWPAKRGRQSYAGDRTVGTLDPGIVAVAMMLTAVANEFDQICS